MMSINYNLASKPADSNVAIQNSHAQPLNGLNFCVNSGSQFPLVYSSFSLQPSSFRRVNFDNTVEILELTIPNVTPGCKTNGIPKENLNIEGSRNIHKVNTSEKIKIAKQTVLNVTPQNVTIIKNIANTENVNVESSSETVDNFKIGTSHKIHGKTLKQAIANLSCNNIDNGTADDYLQVGSSNNISDKTSKEMKLLKQTKRTNKNNADIQKFVLPKENIQLKKSLITYRKVNAKDSSQSKIINRKSNVVNTIPNLPDKRNINNVAVTKNLHGESSKKTTEELKFKTFSKISGNISEQITSAENLKEKSSTKAEIFRTEMLKLMPEENFQLKKSLKTYEKVNTKKYSPCYSLHKTTNINQTTLNMSTQNISNSIEDVTSTESIRVESLFEIAEELEADNSGNTLDEMISKRLSSNYENITGTIECVKPVENLQLNSKSKTLNETSNDEIDLTPNKTLKYKKANNTNKNKCNFCRICNKSLISCQKIKAYNSYICCACNDSLKIKTDSLQNTLIHREKENICNFCHKFFNDSAQVIRHVSRAHLVGSKQKRYLCDICDREFVDKSVIVAHRKFHFISPCSLEGEIKTCNSQVCNVCWKNYRNKGPLDIPYGIHHHRTLHRIKKIKYFYCDLCPKRFKRKDAFEDHQNHHKGLIAHECKQCGKKFSRKPSLQSHLRAVHSIKQSHVCKYCSKVFSKLLNLQKHINRHIWPHKCEFCSMAFLSVHTLHTHRRTHTGERPYVCDVCQKGFSLKHNWMVHNRIHTGEKPYVCEICNKAFRVKTLLQVHCKTTHSYRSRKKVI